MFTGIITNLGKLQKKEKTIFTFTADNMLLKKLDKGASIAVNGICFTILQKPKGNSFSVEIMPETEEKTNIQYLQINDSVNLELPATADTFLSGHIVQGHVDQTVRIKNIKKVGNSYAFIFSLPSKLKKYMVKKGSITINGISLTIINIDKNSFSVGIIPHTWKNTMLSGAKIGDFVNIEVDVLAKYIEKLINPAPLVL